MHGDFTMSQRLGPGFTNFLILFRSPRHIHFKNATRLFLAEV